MGFLSGKTLEVTMTCLFARVGVAGVEGSWAERLGRTKSIDPKRAMRSPGLCYTRASC